MNVREVEKLNKGCSIISNEMRYLIEVNNPKNKLFSLVKNKSNDRNTFV